MTAAVHCSTLLLVGRVKAVRLQAGGRSPCLGGLWLGSLGCAQTDGSATAFLDIVQLAG